MYYHSWYVFATMSVQLCVLGGDNLFNFVLSQMFAITALSVLQQNKPPLLQKKLEVRNISFKATRAPLDLDPGCRPYGAHHKQLSIPALSQPFSCFFPSLLFLHQICSLHETQKIKSPSFDEELLKLLRLKPFFPFCASANCIDQLLINISNVHLTISIHITTKQYSVKLELRRQDRGGQQIGGTGHNARTHCTASQY